MKQISFILITLLSLIFISSCNQNNQNLKPQITASVGKPIINGSLDTSNAHQAVVMLYSTSAGEMCTGTVITPTVVLTAAHCVVDTPDPANMEIYFGNDENSFYAQRTAIDIWHHPEYPNSNTGVYNDIALITMNSPAPSNVVPIPPLPASKAITTADQNSLQLEFVGFGKDENNQTGVKLHVYQTLQAECDVAADSYCNIGSISPYQIPGGTISYSQNPGGPCSGDSGGPAFIIRDGQEYVAGITSYGDQYCTDYGVSTKADYFESEINAYIGGGTSYENCTNGIDDDGDNAVDCDDSDCAYNSACQENACDNVITLNCGDSISASTSSGSSSFSSYNCTSNWTEDGPEVIYLLNATNGTSVTVHLAINSSNSDLDLLILQGSCDNQSCIDGSANEGNTAEETTIDISGDTYAVVETFDNAGNYTISLTCSGGTSPENCTNGIDDDGDGFIDCNDSDCASNSACQSTSENCTNGIDDDGDGFVDCADSDCASNSACQSTSENCTNGIDDDNDGATDCDDADCASTSTCTNRQEICDDGIDNDDDGATDCSDVDCASASNCNGSDHSENCANGIDDDGDTKIDCNDPDCRTYYNCTPPQEICDDGVDNDGDGAADCSDADCASFFMCNSTTNIEICYDGVDNDGDGIVDCNDPDCLSYSKCSQTATTTEDSGCNCSTGNSNIPPSLPLFLMIFSLYAIIRKF